VQDYTYVEVIDMHAFCYQLLWTLCCHFAVRSVEVNIIYKLQIILTFIRSNASTFLALDVLAT